MECGTALGGPLVDRQSERASRRPHFYTAQGRTEPVGKQASLGSRLGQVLRLFFPTFSFRQSKVHQTAEELDHGKLVICRQGHKSIA